MKIAITGHTSGIGKAFTKILSQQGHSILGISRRDGENIRRVTHTAKMIKDCDMFINNAQSMFAQTELLCEVWNLWQGQDKTIWNISTHMTMQPINTVPDNNNDIDMCLYRIQKLSLEEACRQLQFKKSKPRISIIRPGRVKDNHPDANTPLEWAQQVVNIMTAKNFYVPEISLIQDKK